MCRRCSSNEPSCASSSSRPCSRIASARSSSQLELTEGSLFEHRTGEFREDALETLRDLGVKIAIDDFGTGYSSLSYLKRWRVDSLKIDRSFVRDIARDPSDHAIVSAIVAMARSLNIQVVAEGIETWQQLEILRNMGCSLAQGFLFAQAVPGDRCVALPARRTARPARVQLGILQLPRRNWLALKYSGPT